MALKDYYEILELPVSASADEIRKAHRKLVMRYHPDRNHGNPYAQHHFQEIQEAYEVLSNPAARSEYQEKRRVLYPWEKNVIPPLTVDDLVKQATELESQWYEMDFFRMDHSALQTRLCQLLSERHLQLLNGTADSNALKQFFAAVLHTAGLLPYPQLPEVLHRLQRLSTAYPPAAEKLAQFARERKMQYRWDKYKGYLILFLALVISLLIYLIA